MLAMEGANDAIKTLAKNDIALGLVTGAAKGMVTNMLDRAGLDFHAFKFGVYGNAGKTMEDIVKVAAETVFKEAGLGGERIVVVSSSPRTISGAKASGLIPIGIATGSFSAEQLRQAGAKLVMNRLTDKKGILKTVLA